MDIVEAHQQLYVLRKRYGIILNFVNLGSNRFEIRDEDRQPVAAAPTRERALEIVESNLANGYIVYQANTKPDGDALLRLGGS